MRGRVFCGGGKPFEKGFPPPRPHLSKTFRGEVWESRRGTAARRAQPFPYFLQWSGSKAKPPQGFRPPFAKGGGVEGQRPRRPPQRTKSSCPTKRRRGVQRPPGRWTAGNPRRGFPGGNVEDSEKAGLCGGGKPFEKGFPPPRPHLSKTLNGRIGKVEGERLPSESSRSPYFL